MNGQGDLFTESDVERRFREFDEANPDLWRSFVDMAQELIAGGRKHYSARDIFAVIRWHTRGLGTDGDGFKVNNNFSAFYARRFHATYPEHVGFFELRRSEADQMIARPRARSATEGHPNV